MIMKLPGSDEKLRKQEIEIVSMLNRWYQVKEDLIYSFEKIALSDISEPSKSYIKDFVARVKGGIDIDTALEMMSDSYDDHFYKYVLKQLRFNIRYRGNTGELLDNLESQMMKLDEEATRRKISTSRERRIIKVIYFLSPIAGIISIVRNPVSGKFFLETQAGMIAMIAAGAIYLSGLLFYCLTGRNSSDV